jgi:signal transduction histidine kinase
MRRLFSGLQTRLILSYVVIVLLTLAAITTALFIFLETRQSTAQPERDNITARLTQFLIETIEGNQTFANRPNGSARIPRNIMNRLTRGIYVWRQQEVRLLLVDSEQRVIHDTAVGPARYADGALVSLSNTEPVPSTSSTLLLIQGDLRSPDDSSWIYVGEALAAGKNSYIVAIRPPRQSEVISAVLDDYGETLTAPLIQAGLVGIFVAVILAVIITRSVALPLKKVAEAASAAARGDLDQRAPVTGPAEVRTVAQAFNHMTDEVTATQQAQRDFLANVTHDLRTPLTSIQGFSQAIMDGVASDPTAATRAAAIINDEAGRMNRMVQELLDLARVEAGRFNMTKQTIKLHELLVGLGERLMPKTAEKGIMLEMDVPALPSIAGDGDRLIQMFTNLIDNAIKHTPSGGTITLMAAVKNNGVLIKVRDTGEGIPAEDLPHIFERFYQVDKSRQRKEGAGLGLTITKQIIEAHSGTISAESVEGLGTVFSVWFPALPMTDSSSSKRRIMSVSKSVE